MVKVLRKLDFLFCGRLLKRLKRLCWKRSRRVKACVGSNPMSSVIRCKKRCFSIAKGYGRKVILFEYEYLWKYLKTISAKKISILLFILFNSVVK